MNIFLSLGVQDTLRSVPAVLLQSLHFTHVACSFCHIFVGNYSWCTRLKLGRPQFNLAPSYFP